MGQTTNGWRRGRELTNRIAKKTPKFRKRIKNKYQDREWASMRWGEKFPNLWVLIAMPVESRKLSS